MGTTFIKISVPACQSGLTFCFASLSTSCHKFCGVALSFVLGKTTLGRKLPDTRGRLNVFCRSGGEGVNLVRL